MIGRVAATAAWLTIGAGVIVGLYWLFLNTPEANALTLAASAGLVVAMVVAGAFFLNAAILMTTGASTSAALVAALKSVHWLLAAAVPAAIVWGGTAQIDRWIAGHAGEISAWFIATLGWSDVRWLFVVCEWLSRWTRWVLVPVLALSLLAAILGSGLGALRRQRWLRRALHWRTILMASLTVGVLFLAPWQLTAWRPDLPPTWVQPATAALRLALVVALWAIGAALLLAIAARPIEPHAKRP